MTGKEGYDVLRLITHGQTCYISSEYVEGRILAGWLKSNPNITKEQLFSLIREITNQLSMIHKCRKKPYYQYVNPYSLVVTEDGMLYFLDLEAGSNEKRLRFMQRRIVRECFLPKDEAYYQRGSAKLDIYGLGKTIQYLLATAMPTPPLSGREERRFLRIILKCLNDQIKTSYQNAADIRRNIPQYKKKAEHTPVIRKRLVMAAGVTVILSAAWKLKETQGLLGTGAEAELSDMTQESFQQESTLKERETQEETLILMRGSGEAYMDLALAYILDLEDYEKGLYYLDKIQEYAEAVNLKDVAEALMGKEKEPEVLEESLSNLEEKADKDPTGRYDRCLIRGYGLLNTEQALEEILRLGRRCLNKADGEEEMKEIQEYMALAYENMAEIYIDSGLYEKAKEICIQGIEELGGSEKLTIAYMRLMCQDETIGRDICAQTIQEYILKTPEILESEGLKELMREYEIQIEGDQVWVGR